MKNPDDKIHVIPLGGHWEVETQSGAPLAHEEEKHEAVEIACELAREQGVDTVIVHDGDGVTEAVKPVPGPDKPQD
jgi:diacylglycerol kinase family enzyme